MKKIYPYSQDKEFLETIDSLTNQEQWIRIILLDFKTETPIMNIEGEIASGTLNKDGSSAVRRTCNLSCAIDAFTYDVDDVQSKYSIGKKIFLELGVTNQTNEYQEEDIVWFPQGTFFISSFSISSSSSGATSISLQFKDKMAMLDGTVGGTLPATTRFDTVTEYVDGAAVSKKVLVYDIIMEAVNHFGGEDLSNIVIDDVPRRAKRIIRWLGDESIWIFPVVDEETSEISYDICFNSDIDEKEQAYQGKGTQYTQNQDIGFMYEDFVYDDELTFAAGSKVTDVLDKIKNWLGNYEYFYDENGIFHFQEIKNYLNTSQSTYVWDDMQDLTDEDYLYESSKGKAVYTFADDTNLTSITNSPLYENIKNDYIVEGTTTNNNIKSTVRYHLVIDDKPAINNDGFDNVLVYEDPVTGNYTLGRPIIQDPTQEDEDSIWIWSLPDYAADGDIYALIDEPQVFSFKKKLKTIKEFDRYYSNIVSNENTINITESSYPLGNTEGSNLITILENYIYLILNDSGDTSVNQCLWYDAEMLTIIRHLKRAGQHGTATDNSIVDDYLSLLATDITSDSLSYGIAARQSTLDELHQLCTLAYWLYHDIYTDYTGYNEITKKLIDKYRYTKTDETNYWPIISTEIRELFAGLDETKYTAEDALLAARLSWINKELSNIDVIKDQVSILSSVYNNIISNYSILLKSVQKEYDNLKVIENPTEEQQAQLELKKSLIELYTNTQDIMNEAIGTYKEKNDAASERASVLYALLTSLGQSDSTMGDCYIEIDIMAPAYVTSFWYFDASSDTGHTYGWNELKWYCYYHSYEDVKVNNLGIDYGYYHDGLGGESYIDFSSSEFWDDIDYTVKEIDAHYGIKTISGHSSSISFQSNFLVINNVGFRFADDGIVIEGDAVSRAVDDFPIADDYFNTADKKVLAVLKDYGTLQFSDLFPSMNCNSEWYQRYYRAYAKENKLHYFNEDNEGYSYVPKDWRTELILEGMEAAANGTETSWYYAELLANWPSIYDFKNEYLVPSSITDVDYFINTTAVITNSGYRYVDTHYTNANMLYVKSDTAKIKDHELIIEETTNNYSNTNYHYFFDMIDASSSRWGEYSVKNIGRRTNVTTSDSINCIFAPDTPNFAYINVTGMSTQERQEAMIELEGVAENIIQVTDSYYQNFATGGLKQSAYDQIKYDLQQHTSYQNTVSVTARPCFYLEPNVRAELQDVSTGTKGDYVIKTISIPLGAGNNMSVSLSKALERL